MKLRTALLASLALLWLSLPSVASPTAITDLGSLGGENGNALGINERGQVVGWSRLGEDFRHPFLWEDGVMIDLGNLGSTSDQDELSRATAINNRGQVVGETMDATGRGRAFLWENGVMTDLGTLGGSRSSATDVNDHGQVVGNSRTATGASHAFLWEKGVMTDLGTLGGDNSNALAINNRGQVVGSSTIAGGERRAFLWEKGVMVDLGTLGAITQPFMLANDINNRGQVVGIGRCDELRSDCVPGDLHGFIWENGTLTDLLDLTAGGTYGEGLRKQGNPQAINERGQIALSGYSLSGYPVAMLWTRGSVTVLEGLAAGSSNVPLDMNENGQIVGFSASGGNLHPVLWDVVAGAS